MASCPEENTNITENIKYDGPHIPCSDIETCDDLNVAFEKMDSVICDIIDNVSSIAIDVNQAESDVTDITNSITDILNQLGLCCPTTTTTTTIFVPTTTTTSTTAIPCLIYYIQAIEDGASWSAIDCEGNYIGGFLPNTGDIESTTCVQGISVEGIGINILIGVECTTTTTTTTSTPTTTTTTTVAPTTTTTTTLLCDCFYYNITVLQSDLNADDTENVQVNIPLDCEGYNVKIDYGEPGVYKVCVNSSSAAPFQYIFVSGNIQYTLNQPVNTGECCTSTPTTTTTTTIDTSCTEVGIDAATNCPGQDYATVQYTDCEGNIQVIQSNPGELPIVCMLNSSTPVYLCGTGDFQYGESCVPTTSTTTTVAPTTTTTTTVEPTTTTTTTEEPTTTTTTTVEPTTTTTTTSALFEGIISATSDPSDACPLALTDTVWIEGNYDRFFSDSGGTIPFVGGNAYWHVQKLVDAFSRGQDIDNDGYPISPAVLC